MTTDAPHAPCPTSATAAAVLSQCAAFIADLPEGVYDRPCETMMGATIGQHLRHSVDHVAAILSGLDTGVIDYDHRDRGVPVETDPAVAAETISSVLDRLAHVDTETAARPVTVRVMLTSAGESADLASTVGRELAFAAHHETHHHAMIAAIAAHHGCPVPAGFGVAPSTLNYQDTGPNTGA